jgi:hypothetical protein
MQERLGPFEIESKTHLFQTGRVMLRAPVILGVKHQEPAASRSYQLAAEAPFFRRVHAHSSIWGLLIADRRFFCSTVRASDRRTQRSPFSAPRGAKSEIFDTVRFWSMASSCRWGAGADRPGWCRRSAEAGEEEQQVVWLNSASIGTFSGSAWTPRPDGR